MLLSGASGSGKSSLLSQMITDPEWGLTGKKFSVDKIMIICPTLGFDESYNKIVNYLESYEQYDKDGERI